MVLWGRNEGGWVGEREVMITKIAVERGYSLRTGI